MKKLLLSLLLATLCCLGANAQKTYALIAGVSNYSDQQANLYNTTKDVKKLKTVLDKQKFTVAMLTSKYANHDNIVKKLSAIVRLAKPEDKILFFFSGHGDTGGFLTYELQMFRYRELVDILSKARARQVVCFIDACRAGSVNDVANGNYGWGEGGTHPSLTFVMSCRANEFSYENNWVGNGYFTKALLKGLRGVADKNEDRKVTLDELFRYVYNDVTARTKNDRQTQHPQLIGPGSALNTVITSW